MKIKMKRFIGCLMTLSFLFVMGGTAMSEELITNGDFEEIDVTTGSFAEWVVNDFFGETVPFPLESWLVNDGNVEIPIPDTTDTFFYASDPISGNYDAISDYTALGMTIGMPYSVLVKQNVTLPSNIISATLSWKDRIYSFDALNGFVQSFGVVISDDSGSTTNLFIAEGDPEQPGPNSRSITEIEVDDVILSLTEFLQSLEGQEVNIHFVVFATEAPFFVTVDDVSLEVYTTDDIVDVEIDIKPGSDPNSFNNDGHGVIPVAILGSEDFDVNTIDAGSVMLEGLAIKAVGKSNKLLAHYEDVNSDGYEDLVVQIEDDDLVFEEGDTIATVTGNSNNGIPIQGSDTICIVP